MLQFSIGISALQTAQQGLSITGNNLTNASTPGYHRQTAEIASNIPTQSFGLSVGTGVSVTDINRAVSDQLDTALTQQQTQNGFTDISLTTGTQIQSVISTNTNSPATQLEALLNQLQQLSATPMDGSSRQATVTSANTVANTFNTAAADLSQIQNGLDSQMSGDVAQVNILSKQIADLNAKISAFNSQGISANTLLDQRGQLVNNLAHLMNIQVSNGNNGQITVITSGTPLVIGTQSQTLVFGTGQGVAAVSAKGSDAALSLSGGELGGLLSERNGELANFQSRLDKLARQIVTSFNAIQSTGLGGNGGFTDLTGQNGVSSSTARLNAAGLAFPPTSGSLFVGVTNTATGQRTVTEVPINPQSQSLQDVANSITSTVPNVQAFVNSQTGTLTLTSSTGYTFDFTGGFSSSPTTNFPGGTTSVPTIGGIYSGTKNDNYTFTFTSSGTVGVTPGLQAQVTNSAGDVIGTVNVGQGYQPGKAITVANGVTLNLGSGNATSGDSFSTSVISNPDTAGLLSALGLNTMFTGSSAATMAVSSDIKADPSRLATSRTGQPGDISNLIRFTGLGSAAVLNGSQTFSQYSNQMVSDIGDSVQSLTQQQTTNQTLTTNITSQQQSVSGVDTNEELANVMKFQQMFEIASKYIGAVNDALTQLLQI